MYTFAQKRLGYKLISWMLYDKIKIGKIMKSEMLRKHASSVSVTKVRCLILVRILKIIIQENPIPAFSSGFPAGGQLDQNGEIFEHIYHFSSHCLFQTFKV